VANLFKRGYAAVREEKQRQDENREKAGKQLYRFFLSKDGDEAQLRFLTEEPINFDEHTLKVIKGGKERFESAICTANLGNCTYCDDGDKPSFRGAFLVYDKRPYEYTDKDGKKKSSKGSIRLYVQGARVLSQLDRLSERYGLTTRDYIVTRSGNGQQTSYMFDRTDEVSKLTPEEIKNMLPEKLRDEYNGTMDSLYEIVQNQLEMLVEMGADADDDDDDEENGQLVGVSKEVDKPSEKTVPVSKGTSAKPLLKGSVKPKPVENSIKKLLSKGDK